MPCPPGVCTERKGKLHVTRSRMPYGVPTDNPPARVRCRWQLLQVPHNEKAAASRSFEVDRIWQAPATCTTPPGAGSQTRTVLPVPERWPAPVPETKACAHRSSANLWRRFTRAHWPTNVVIPTLKPPEPVGALVFVSLLNQPAAASTAYSTLTTLNPKPLNPKVKVILSMQLGMILPATLLLIALAGSSGSSNNDNGNNNDCNIKKATE